jgi:hypothetical protein
MRQLRVTINADAIAKGVLAMMRERYAVSRETEDSEDLIRFGMLPKRWMDMLESQMTNVICERFNIAEHEKAKNEVTTIIKTGDGDDDYATVTFNPRELVNEMVHEVTLALYANVAMVV